MAHIDRLFGILLILQRKRSVSAAQLARQFEVSTRTIYRDLQTLSALGVPVYTSRGHGGGIHLLEGYFLPPLTFSRGEGIMLLVGLTLLQSLHTFPFPAEVKTAVQKLLVAVPDSLRMTLMQAEKVVGFEHFPGDIFHPEPTHAPQMDGDTPESSIITTFLQGILDRSLVHVRYGSPYHLSERQETAVIPLGLFWDRNHWYLVGRKRDGDATMRLWRADRVVSLRGDSETVTPPHAFDIQPLLGHTWLRSAMDQWQRNAPVIIRLTRLQAERLQRDWYYRHARFEERRGDQVIMTIGEENQTIVFELLRWLGPGAELIEPRAWREQMKEELRQMLSIYDTPE
ncbi:helix-turn-helix transcriptional regulator [Ktedonobacter racemifer]|uniref:Helix-turn-helix type 11 domain protein n=1 Tax=Ktedonobacter racemifer DSM 44963 TaxID=485913 RepID=D6U1N1_KTERA|nr:YafY family protein [Ktedonobacter racemifer]EFH82675.1 Helix-turn-helix type 11 domain protein [Ktedonobacter racemifer DSM 44963]